MNPYQIELEYVGGGWFRRKGVPKGQPAFMVHGNDALKVHWDREALDRVLDWPAVVERNRVQVGVHPSEVKP